jgi:hypothetical protein
MFEPFPSLTRFSQDWTVTEKIDGSNAQIFIHHENEEETAINEVDGLFISAGSRSRYLDTTKQGDHMGFAKWVYQNSQALVELLSPGHHYGEWWGNGIQRGYGLTEKRFSLFNVGRWKEEAVSHIPGLHVVPILSALGDYMDCPGLNFRDIMQDLKEHGSYAADFDNPEGIVMFHGRSGTLFKKTFDYDEKGKWAEKHDKGEHSKEA